MSEELSKDDYNIGFSDKEGSVLIVTIPLRKWSENEKYGDIFISGVFAKAERVALKSLSAMRMEKKQMNSIKPGVIGPNGQPLAVH